METKKEKILDYYCADCANYGYGCPGFQWEVDVFDRPDCFDFDKPE